MKNKKDPQREPFIINARRILSCYGFNFLELLAVKTKLFNKLIIKLRRPVFLNDIKTAKISKKDKVLLIGCGIFPSHTIMIAQETKADIIGIDNSKGAVKVANKYIKKHDLSDIVKVEYGDGRFYPVKDFDIIFIAGNVFPIDDVLIHLANNMKKGGKILSKSINYDVPKALKNTGLEDVLTISKITENPKTQTYLIIKN